MLTLAQVAMTVALVSMVVQDVILPATLMDQGLREYPREWKEHQT